MKKILAILLVIVSALLIAPYIIGSQAESKIREIYLNASQNPKIEFNISDYDRGWFSSTVKIELKLAADTIQQNKDFTFVLTQDMQHGPFLWEIDDLGLGLADISYGIELPSDIQADLDKIEGLPNDAVSAVTRLSFDGSSTSFFFINPFNISQDQSKIAVKKGEFKAVVNMAGNIIFSGEWEGMQINQQDKNEVSIGLLSLNGDQNLISGEMFSPTAIFEGDITLSLKNINVVGDYQEDSIDINQISIESSTAFKDDLAKFDIFIGAKQVKAIGQEFNDFAYDISFENLDKESLLLLNQILMDAGSTDETLLLEKMKIILPKLIEKKPLFKINKMGIKTSEGEINMTAVVAINRDLYKPENPMSFMSAVNANTSGFAPIAFFEQFGLATDIDMLVQQNMLVKENGLLKFELSFENGQATLNGAPIPLGM